MQTMTVPALTRTKNPQLWQYHSRGARHSITPCWGVLFDLMANSDLLRRHVADGKVIFGLDHPMHDYRLDTPKKLDLVIARPDVARQTRKKPLTFRDLPKRHEIVLTDEQQSLVDRLPNPVEGPVGAVLLALEAKACMTAHQKSYPRFYSELNSSHRAIHGSSTRALAVGMATINASVEFISPIINPRYPEGVPPIVSHHKQPGAALGAIEKVRQLPRRTSDAEEGFDGLAITIVDCINDGRTPIRLADQPTVPDNYVYDRMVTRIANEYDVRFRNA